MPGEMIQFDLRISFKGVAQPPTRILIIMVILQDFSHSAWNWGLVSYFMFPMFPEWKELFLEVQLWDGKFANFSGSNKRSTPPKTNGWRATKKGNSL